MATPDFDPELLNTYAHPTLPPILDDASFLNTLLFTRERLNLLGKVSYSDLPYSSIHYNLQDHGANINTEKAITPGYTSPIHYLSAYIGCIADIVVAAQYRSPTSWDFIPSRPAYRRSNWIREERKCQCCWFISRTFPLRFGSHTEFRTMECVHGTPTS